MHIVTADVAAGLMLWLLLMCVLQLYLNYKLKSVAHLPWRQMTYKFLNTIIDDLFAFVIKMPILHRISVFRWGGLWLLAVCCDVLSGRCFGCLLCAVLLLTHCQLAKLAVCGHMTIQPAMIGRFVPP